MRVLCSMFFIPFGICNIWHCFQSTFFLSFGNMSYSAFIIFDIISSRLIFDVLSRLTFITFDLMSFRRYLPFYVLSFGRFLPFDMLTVPCVPFDVLSVGFFLPSAFFTLTFCRWILYVTQRWTNCSLSKLSCMKISEFMKTWRTFFLNFTSFRSGRTVHWTEYNLTGH
jgi:hypothetical protein